TTSLAAAAPNHDGSHAPQVCLAGGCDAPAAHHASAPPCDDRVWVEGRWTWTTERVCVSPARTERIWVPPVYSTRYDPCGRARRVIVRHGYWDHVHVPARWENRRVRRWVEGYWTTRSRSHGNDRHGRRYDRRGHDRHASGSVVRIDRRGIDIDLRRLLR
ncbi:MAG: hypothetical protein AAGK32_18340, partial [Actinomycetota bacterium]